MPAKKGQRGWGHIRQLPSGRYQASYIGPDMQRHTADNTYTVRTNAEGWLAQERQKIELKTWRPPSELRVEEKITLVPLADYADTWVQRRRVKGGPLKPRTRALYESLLANHIKPALGRVAVGNLTVKAVNAWHAGLTVEQATRNKHAYSLLKSICETAVKEGLLERNPCQIDGALDAPRKRDPILLEIPEVAALADAIRPARFKALVLLSAWGGLRWGEVTELRRDDVGPGCETLRVERAVTYSDGQFRVSTTKSGKPRTVVVPPHIRAALKHLLDSHAGKDGQALLFPNTKGQHLNDTVFRRLSFRPALAEIGREGVRVHDLRHFCGTTTARVANLVETMHALGHSTPKASLIYQGLVSERPGEIAVALSRLAESDDMQSALAADSG